MPSSPAAQIALTHTCFNILTTIILLPLGNYLAKRGEDPARAPRGQGGPALPGVPQPHPDQQQGRRLGVSAIYVDAPDKSSGKRVQHIHIQYDGLGFIPLNELMKEETA